MFGWEDMRTPEEKKRDHELGRTIKSNQKLALGFLKNLKPVLKEAGLDVGMVGKGLVFGAELLVESDGITYKIKVDVDNDH